MNSNLKDIVEFGNRIAVTFLVLTFVLLMPLSARSAVTLQLTNNFASDVLNGSDYFSNNYSDDQIWLYFLNVGGCVTYTDTDDQAITASNATAFKLSTVKDLSFTLNASAICNSTKLYASFGTTSPFTGNNGPGIFDQDIPYAVIEWTVAGNQYDNIDVTYEDTAAFPTCLTVENANSTQTDQACFPDGTDAEHVINALKNVMPNAPTGPQNDNYPSQGDNPGWGPLVPTVSGDNSANRWIGSSKYWQSAADSNGLASVYLYAPSLNDYLKYLHDNESKLFGESGKSGWYVDYSGNTGYSFYVSVTGSDNNYGLKIHDILVGTNPSAPDWKADHTVGASTQGEILIAANNASLSYNGSNYIGNWTDATIYSGASLLNGDFATGPIVTGSDDFASNGDHVGLNATILASLSASMATGLLGSEVYVNKIKDSTMPGSTCYWFNTLERDQALTTLFDSAWPNGEEFYDPFWYTMAVFTDMQGYLSPFNDRWSHFSPDFSLAADYTVFWDLGIKSSGQSATLTMATSLGSGGTTVPSIGTHTEKGKLLSIKATPATDYSFDKWIVSGNGVVINSTDPTTWLTLTGDATVTAVFVKSFPWILFQPRVKK